MKRATSKNKTKRRTKVLRAQGPSRDMARFQALVLDYYAKAGRHDLPWRKTGDRYAILVSEMMLQQTQVPRVIPKYESFLKRFPTVTALASAPLASVIKEWSGLGYNRRAKFLHDAAKVIVERFGGVVPSNIEDLESLPGIGPYTARAVATFADDTPSVFIETNIRSAFIDYFFPSAQKIGDAMLFPLIQAALQGHDPRQWYWALMDYGVYLKALRKNPSRRSAHHTKQSKFNGSLREARGAILKELAEGPALSLKDIRARTQIDMARIRKASAALLIEGFIEQRGEAFRLAQ